MQLDREYDRLQQLRAEVEAAVSTHARRCVAAAARVIREAIPTAAAVEIDLREWFDQVAGVRLLLVRDNAGDPIAVDRSAGWEQARLDAEMYLHDALDFTRRPDLCQWERLDHGREEYPEQDRYLVTLPAWPLTITDLARRFDVTRAAVCNWIRRYDQNSPTPFPEPDRPGRNPQWDAERWPEFERWNVERKGSRRGRRRQPDTQKDEWLTIGGLAQALGVSKGAINKWCALDLPEPFPLPAQNPSQGHRRWRRDQLADVRAWVKWYDGYKQARRQEMRARPTVDTPTVLSPAYFLRPARPADRVGVRQGRLLASRLRRHHG